MSFQDKYIHEEDNDDNNNNILIRQGLVASWFTELSDVSFQDRYL